MSFNMTSLQRPDRRKRRLRASATPILFELRPMRRRPFHHQTPHSMRQVPKQHGKRRDVYYSPMLAVSHVEVRRRMIVIVHRHDDTEESTDLGHLDEPGAPGRRGCHRSIAWQGILLGAGGITSQDLD